jgi:predicted  nucleic acid-binding Zn ribbon protein
MIERKSCIIIFKRFYLIAFDVDSNQKREKSKFSKRAIFSE